MGEEILTTRDQIRQRLGEPTEILVRRRDHTITCVWTYGETAFCFDRDDRLFVCYVQDNPDPRPPAFRAVDPYGLLVWPTSMHCPAQPVFYARPRMRW